MQGREIMLDTNVFNNILDGEIDLEELVNFCDAIYITHVQEDELNATRNTSRKEKLIQTLKIVGPKKVATESAVWDVSRWGEAKWGTSGYHLAIKTELDRLKVKANNTQDALIGEAAIVNGYTLITNDKNLAKVIIALGGKTKDFRF